MKYTKTKYPNIYTYETSKGKSYYIRRSFMLNGRKKEVTKSGLKTLTDARLALTEIEKQIDDGDFHTNKNLTVNQYWERYWEKKIKTGQWTPDTEAFKISTYTNHFEKPFGNTKLKDLEREAYELYITDKLNNYSRHTVRQLHGVFMGILNDAVACGNLSQNILQKIYIGDSKVKPQNKRLTLEEFKAFDQVAREILDDYDYAIIRVAYFGLRRSEVLGIQLKTPHERQDGWIELHLTSSRTELRNGTNRHGQESMKTKESQRTVVLDHETSLLIRKAIKTSKTIAKQCGRILAPDDYVFLNRKKQKGEPLFPTRINYLCRKIEDHSKIHITPHMLRHFFATQGVLVGVPIEHMAAALGHSTSYMTEKYTHIQEEISASVTDNFIKAIQ